MPQATWATQQQVEEQQEENEQETTPATTENATGETQANQQQQASAEEKRFTQADIDAAIKERLDRAKKQAEDAQKKAADEAEAKRLQDNQQFKELSEKQAGDLLTLTTEKEQLAASVTALQAENAQYKTLFEAQLNEQKKALSEPVLTLLNALNVLEQAKWLTENAAKLGIGMKGVPPNPKSGGGGNTKDEEAARQQTERRYSNF